MIRSLGATVLGLFVITLLAQPAGAAIRTYFTNMSGAAESPPNSSPGTGSATITYDDAAHTMRVQASFQDLTGTTTIAHIHTPTALAFTGTAGVATQQPSFQDWPAGVTSGSYDHTFDLTQASSWNSTYITNNGGSPATAEAAFFSQIEQGRAYFNVHTSTFGGGEIRGFLVPEPGAITLLAGAAVVALVRRRRLA